MIEAELVVDGDLTRLMVEERGLPSTSSPHTEPAGKAHVEDLAVHLDGGERVDRRTRWTELTHSYREQAGATTRADREASNEPAACERPVRPPCDRRDQRRWEDLERRLQVQYGAAAQVHNATAQIATERVTPTGTSIPPSR